MVVTIHKAKEVRDRTAIDPPVGNSKKRIAKTPLVWPSHMRFNTFEQIYSVTMVREILNG